jgi:hypothetical protein
MLNYVPKALTRFQHQAPSKLQHQPYPHVKPNYGAKVQLMEDTDTSALLPPKGKKFIQEVISTFLYYAQCVDSTVLAALCYTTGKPNQDHNEKDTAFFGQCLYSF